MTTANRPILNLDLDLLRTFVAVADLNTFAAAAVAVCRTQSAVSQQMQRLEQLVGKELFARHGRNKLLTEHGIQLLGYARKILRFNDEACTSLMYNNIKGVLTIGASDDTADTILPFLLNRVTAIYPKLAIDVRVKRSTTMVDLLEEGEIELAVTTADPAGHPHIVLRTSPTLWYCAADYHYQAGEPIPLVVMDEPSPFRALAIKQLDEAGIPWRIAYVASTLSAVRAACKAGRAADRDDEPRSAGAGGGGRFAAAAGYPVCAVQNAQCSNELAMAIFSAMQGGNDGYGFNGAEAGLQGDQDDASLVDEEE